MLHPPSRAARIGLLLAVAFVAAACSDDDGPAASTDPAEFAAQELESTPEPTTDDGGPTTTSGSAAIVDPGDVPGAPIDKFNLEVGDCFDFFEVLEEGRPVSRTTELGCDEPHHFEIYHRFIHPAPHPSVFPGDGVMREYAVQVCYREFEAWVDAEYELSTLEIGVIIPNRENFEGERSRYRGIHCWVEDADGEPMVGTSRGSGW